MTASPANVPRPEWCTGYNCDATAALGDTHCAACARIRDAELAAMHPSLARFRKAKTRQMALDALEQRRLRVERGAPTNPVDVRREDALNAPARSARQVVRGWLVALRRRF